MKIHPIWFVCILTRASLAYIVYKYGNINQYIDRSLTAIILLMGLGFMYKGYYGSNNETQIARVFWHDTRYVHGILYITSAAYLFMDKLKISSLLIMVDLLFSIGYRIITNQ